MCLQNYSRCKALILYLISVSVVSPGDCNSHRHSLETKSEPSQKHVEALNHVKTLLGDLQRKIKESRDILKRLANSSLLRHSAPVNQPAKQHIMSHHGVSDIERVLGSLGVPMYSHDPAKVKGVMSMLTSALSMLRTVLVPGEVLDGEVTTAKPADAFDSALHDEMKELNIGYLSVGFERLCEQIALKHSKDMRGVMRYADFLIEKYIEQRRFRWLHQPSLQVLSNMASAVSGMPADEVKSYAIMLHFTMLQRRDAISEEVNDIMDYADSLVTKADGERLFTIIHEFKDFPNVTKTGELLCRDIIEAFESPYHKLKGTKPLLSLMNRTNQAFLERFPSLHEFRLDLPADYFDTQPYQRHRPHSTTPLVLFTSGLVRRRRMHDKHILAPRKQIPINNYEYTSSYESTTKQYMKKIKSHYTDVISEQNFRKVSKENNNFYAELSDEYEDTVTTRRLSKHNIDYKLVLDRESDGDSITGITKNEFETTSNGIERKRFTIVPPVLREGHLVDMEKPFIRTRQIIHYTQSLTTKYKLIGRPTTQFRRFRRIHPPKNLKQTASSSKSIYSTAKPALMTSKNKILNYCLTSRNSSACSLVTVNNKHLRKITGSSSYSDEETVLKDNLMNQLAHYNSSFK